MSADGVGADDILALIQRYRDLIPERTFQRVEVGVEVMALLRELPRHADHSIHSVNRVFAYPLFENADLPARAWRTLDRDDNVVSEGGI